jgi:hypothetical protein
MKRTGTRRPGIGRVRRPGSAGPSTHVHSVFGSTVHAGGERKLFKKRARFPRALETANGSGRNARTSPPPPSRVLRPTSTTEAGTVSYEATRMVSSPTMRSGASSVLSN